MSKTIQIWPSMSMQNSATPRAKAALVHTRMLPLTPKVVVMAPASGLV